MAPGNGLKILAWMSVVLLIIITAYISRFLTGSIMLGMLLAYMLLPIYELAFIKTGSKRRSSLIAISAVLIASALIILASYLTVSLGLAGISADVDAAKDIPASDLLAGLKILPNFNHSPGTDDLKMALQGGIIPFITSFILPAAIKEVVDAWILPVLQGEIMSFTLVFPILLVQLIAAIFLAYYLLLNGKEAALRSPDLLPEEQRIAGRHFLNELNGVFKTLLTTNFDIAAYNALVGIAIFSLIGVPFAALWAILAAFLSLIRFFGPWLIFVPLSVSLFLTNDIPKGFLVLIFGVALLEYVPEYILRPRISVGSYPVNTALAFLSYVAPVFVLGPMGIIIGPFVYGLLIAAYRTALQFSEKGMHSQS
ncbi:MAG TPA: AI-2E family transporter [Methanotrichaceae archaeon]|nr:AI-2E family transporter [Methanotrichaceae archaeon]